MKGPAKPFREQDRERIAELESAMYECSFRLGTLSMATEGHMRAQICKANNFLLAALGRTLHPVSPQWDDGDEAYSEPRRLIEDVETLNP